MPPTLTRKSSSLTDGRGAQPSVTSLCVTDSPRRRVAIACQGGGSHTAFTAGVLSRLLEQDTRDDFEFVGLSGSSGGGICALVAWSTLVRGHPEQASALLERFWSANSASMPVERVVNSMMLWGSKVADQWGAASISPYDSFLSAWSLEHLRTMVKSVIDFDGIRELSATPDAPLLLLGAVEVVSGRLKTFNSRAGDITPDAALASAAIPNLFRSVNISGGAYWDGMMTQNPPIRGLLDALPDELWVIQVNPTSIDYEPTTVAEITNRRNELAANLSLLQELSSLEMYDDLIARGELKSDRMRPVTIRLMEMQRPPSAERWGHSSKLDRDPRFIRDMIAHGKTQARDFLSVIAFEDCWRARDGDGILHHVAQGATVSVDLPGVRLDATDDVDTVDHFFTQQLFDLVSIDLTRKRTHRDTVTWELRPKGPDALARATAEARVRQGLITDFTLSMPLHF